jgi:photosystem II stability/assembly factor-like uncharacterized protein
MDNGASVLRNSIGLFLCVASLGCGSILDRGSSNVGIPPLQKPEHIEEINTSAASHSVAFGQWQGVKIKGGKSLAAIQFVDALNGWVAGANQLFSSTDGGRTWRQTKLSAAEDSEITECQFVNSKVGWVVTEKHRWDKRSAQTSILKTENRGKSWTEQHSEKGARVGHVTFLNPHEGWAVGTKIDVADPARYVSLILQTNDGGATWRDKSEALNSVSQDPTGNQEDYATDIYPWGSGNARLVTQAGRIFETTDEGGTWYKVTSLKDEEEQTRIFKIGVLADGSTWIAGGTRSDEGTWGMVAFAGRDGFLYRIHIHGVLFSDAVSLSNDEMLACGSAPGPEQRGESSYGRDIGAIFYSSDRGRTWSTVYSTTETDELNRLAVLDKSHIWVAGNRGIIVSLSR